MLFVSAKKQILKVQNPMNWLSDTSESAKNLLMDTKTGGTCDACANWSFLIVVDM